MNDSSTDKILIVSLAVLVLITAAYTRDATLMGGAIAICGYAIRAIGSRVTKGDVE